MPKSEMISTPSFDRIDPSQCINAKLRKLHRLINQAYQRNINPFGLRGSMLSILFIIGKKAPIDQKTLASKLVLDQSTMSRDVQKLMKRGLIYASVADDARKRLLNLTKEGGILLEEISPVWESLHFKVEQILGDFNVKQIDVLIQAIGENADDL